MSEIEARKAVDDYYAAWNAQDVAAMAKVLHYPHVMIAAARAFVMEDPARFINFDEKIVKKLLKKEEWHHSDLLALETIQLSEDKVHFRIEFGRYRENGEKYAHYHGIWILTRENDHWGILARSIFTP